MPPRARIHRVSKHVEAESLKWMREAIANNRELLKSTNPDTFAGHKTQEPFPPEPFLNSSFSYRSLALQCHRQAKLSSNPRTRNELERMALEYTRQADWQEHPWPESNE